MPTTTASDSLKRSALEYHSKGRRGKIEVVATKPCQTQRDLSLAYTPGVAAPCMEIKRDPSLVNRYTSRGNLVAVVSNGTAVLGLGNIGPLAGKPVMEGKGVLFKRFADIDVFDLEFDTQNPDDIISAVKLLEPTFGGINLEDIKAPECFYVEETLKKSMNIPVFHDDQHGTAIISGAGLINALELVGKKIENVKVVFSGAGAAGIACARFYISLGVRRENMLMTDSKGVLWNGRGDEERNVYKKSFFRDTDARTLADALVGADVFSGVSVKGILTKEMIKAMADRPIIFALANPDPEISFPDAKEARPDAIIATGRSDYPNQINNVLGFPFIFRGTLDVEATAINEEMKLAAAHALAKLAREEVPESVKRAYDTHDLSFGPNYILPKPFDPRVLVWVSSAVAGAAIQTGVARKQLDLNVYREKLMGQIDWSREIMRSIFTLARHEPKKIVFPEGYDAKVIWAASEIASEGIAKPVLLGSRKRLLRRFEELRHNPKGIEIVNPMKSSSRKPYVDAYYKLRQRKGVTPSGAVRDLKNEFYFGTMMVKQGDADGLVAGLSVAYPEVLRPALRIIGPRIGGNLVAGMYMLQHRNNQYFLADCTVNINPNAEELAEIALMAAAEMRRLQIEPKIAMLSFSSFGSVRVQETRKVAQAVERLKKSNPDLMVDGPVQPNIALNNASLAQNFPFADLDGQPNLLVFPTLDASNISLRLIQQFSSAHLIGPIMMGMAKPVHLLSRGAEVSSIINLTAIASVDAQHQSEG